MVRLCMYVRWQWLGYKTWRVQCLDAEDCVQRKKKFFFTSHVVLDFPVHGHN